MKSHSPEADRKVIDGVADHYSDVYKENSIQHNAGYLQSAPDVAVHSRLVAQFFESSTLEAISMIAAV